MFKKSKKLTAIVLTAVMVFALLPAFPLTAQAADVVLTVTFDDDYLGGENMLVNDMLDDIALALSTSGLSEANVTTIKLEGTAIEISKFNWRYLLELFRTTGEGANWGSLTGLDLSDMTNLTTMRNDTGSYSANIPKLTSLDLPTGLASIGDYAFAGCQNLALTSLPSGVIAIGEHAFVDCTSLALTSLPSGVSTIGGDAFWNCTSLALTSLPSGVTSIGNSAFRDCTDLALTSLPSGVTTIGDGAFRGCTSLALTSLPSGVTTIVDGTFRDCTSLALTSLPSGVTSIGDYAFSGCTSLADLVFSGMTAPTVGINAFAGGVTATIHYPKGATGYDDGRFNPLTLQEYSTPNIITRSGDTAPAPPSNSFTGGSVYVKGSGINLVHTTKKDFSDFINARVDSRVISQGTQYKAESGSTVITLFADYLETLDVGSHKLEVHFRGGLIASANFTVVAAETPSVSYQVLKPTRAAGTSVTAQVSNNTLILNGSETTFPAVNIDGYNYLKLRDIAALLNNTQKQFSLEYNADTRTIFLNSGMSYNPIGGELTGTLPPSPTAIATAQNLVVDGKTVSVSAYNIGGYNYFRLRDIAILLNFGVDFSGGAVWIDLSEGYSE